MAFKKCPKCNNVLSYSKFGSNKNRKDGIQSYCALCMKKARKKSAKTEKSKESSRNRQKKYREKKKLMKVTQKKMDSVTKRLWKKNNIKNNGIILNPKPVRKRED